MISCKFNFWFQPIFYLAIPTIYMNMHPGFLS
jgi:hypothetical protein